MSQSTYCIRGWQVGPQELATIRRFSEQYWSQRRSAISRVLCEHWDWRQANGRFKDSGCRVLLLELARQLGENGSRYVSSLTPERNAAAIWHISETMRHSNRGQFL